MKEYALITGASKGIGRSISLQLAAAGYPLLLISRSELELQELAQLVKAKYNINAHYLAIDLSTDTAVTKVKE